MQAQSKIKEIFTSIQGEGPYVGEEHLFIRFCRCNLKCNYCDTDFTPKNAKTYSIDELYREIKNLDYEKISFTGGEPLLEVNFIKEFLEKYKQILNKKIYLETNGTLYNELNEIIDLIDVVSMDIKLKSSAGQEMRSNENEEFIKISKSKEVFIKIVFDEFIEDKEIDLTTKLAKKYDIPIILQPKMPLNNNMEIEKTFLKYYRKYNKVRLIPQIHKFLDLA